MLQGSDQGSKRHTTQQGGTDSDSDLRSDLSQPSAKVGQQKGTPVVIATNNNDKVGCGGSVYYQCMVWSVLVEWKVVWRRDV